eukprot:scaffold5662_cov57-Attheya_sp.AAC.7
MSDETLTPCECWHRLASQLRLTQDSIIDHKPLVDWLHVACTIGTSGHPENLSNNLPYPYPPDRGHDQHRADILREDLPGFFPKTEGALPGTREVVGASTTSLKSREPAVKKQTYTRPEQSRKHPPPTMVVLPWFSIASPTRLHPMLSLKSTNYWPLPPRRQNGLYFKKP